MKTNTEVQYVEKIGEIKEQEFKIKASAASFQILSSGLYSNKIRAICRELFCNAFDSHKEAGTTEIPFEVIIPTFMEPTFTIKDYGTGLSHEQVMTIYTTYFHSTKSDSDEYIGQLGLGSKSPFSYTNQFIVESRQNGKVNVYSMHINESGTPAVSLMGTSDTEEKNGLTIKISVKSGDFYKFVEEVNSTLTFFDPYPIVVGDHTRKEFEYLTKREGWGIRNEKVSQYGKGFIPQIVQGFVCYPIDTQQLINYSSTTVNLTDEGKTILASPIDIFVPIGLVQVAPSREHLSYDKKTIENLIQYVNTIAKEISSSLVDIISNAPTLWDSRIIAGTFMSYDSIYRKLYEKLISNVIEFDYQGKKISPYGFNLTELDDFTGMAIFAHKKSRNNLPLRRSIETLTFPAHLVNFSRNSVIAGKSVYLPLDNNVIICVNDAGIGVSTFKQYIKDNMTVGDTVVELKKVIKKSEIDTKIEDFIDKIGIDKTKVIKTSKLVADGKIVSTQRGSGSVDRSRKPVFIMSSGNGRCSKDSWAREVVDMNAGGYYVKFHRGEWVSSHERLYLQSNLAHFVKILINKKIIGDNPVIVGFNSIDYKKYSKNPNWVDVQDVIEDYIEKNKLSIAIDWSRHEYASKSYYFQSFRSYVKPISSLLPESHEINEFVSVTEKTDAVSYSNLVKFDSISYSKHAGLKDEIIALTKANEITVDLSVIYEKYPLLELYIRGYKSDCKTTKHMIEYINIVDSSCDEEEKELKVV